MAKRGPMAATDRRRQAGHKRPRHLDEGGSSGSNGAASDLAHLFTDRRKKTGEGKRAY